MAISIFKELRPGDNFKGSFLFTGGHMTGADYVANYGKTLRLLRKKVKINQTDFGAMFGFSRKTIQRVERGEQLPNIDTQVKIAEYFDVPLYTFYMFQVGFPSLKNHPLK